MKVTFILPCVGKRAGEPYIRSWSMEPLSIAVLSSLTPATIKKRFYDDRLENIPYDERTDLVALSVETYTARRAYQIAAQFRKRNVPVVMGGFHPTLVPDEVAQHADAVVVGEAENIWKILLDDFQAGRLQKIYRADTRPSLAGIRPDRSIYAGKKYLPVALVETARGCPFACEFCSISCFYRRSYSARPVDDVLAEIQTLKHRSIFFTDDNLMVDRERTRRLLTGLIPMKIRWAGQVSMEVADDEEILKLMRRSRCSFVLIGFESLNPANLVAMGKSVNRREQYERVVAALRRHGIGVYATFVFGYEQDNEQAFEDAFSFSQRHGFFFSAFNHIVPFPGTPLYERLKKEKRLINEPWWLSRDYRFGQVAFRPERLDPAKLSDLCFTYRKKFYQPLSVFRRSLVNPRANCPTPARALLFYILNLFSLRDIRRRQEMPLGVLEVE